MIRGGRPGQAWPARSAGCRREITTDTRPECTADGANLWSASRVRSSVLGIRPAPSGQPEAYDAANSRRRRHVHGDWRRSRCSSGAGGRRARRAVRRGLQPVDRPGRSPGSRSARPRTSTAPCEAAATALPAWAETPAVERARVLFRFRERLAAEAEELARLVTREHGKTLAESRASVQRGVEMVEFACGIPSLLDGPGRCRTSPARSTARRSATRSASASGSPRSTSRRWSRSGCSRWPWPAATRSCSSPRRRCRSRPSGSASCSRSAGCRTGSSTSSTATARCVDALLTHPRVAAISFVGSTAVARHVYETGTRNGKRVQAAGGAKNHLIIMPDADLDQAAKALQASGLRLRRRAVHGREPGPAGGRDRRPPGRPAPRPGGLDDGRPDRRRRRGRHGPGHHPRAPRPRGRLPRHRPGRGGRGRRRRPARPPKATAS